MRILLTSARAPVTLDLARRFSRQGSDVCLCDTLRFGCGAFSRHCRKMFTVPRPRQDPRAYVTQLQRIVTQEGIDLLVPTCEEIFYISRYRDDLQCEVFADSFEKLAAIHNKWQFSLEAGNDAARVPESQQLSSRRDLESLPDSTEQYVFKPIYSRFASEVLLGPSVTKLAEIDISLDKQWIAQRLVRGAEYSTYSIAHNGRLLAHASYTSSYRAGRGSGIYFVPTHHPRLDQFVKNFVSKYHYTGQIGFDCIVDENDVPWILEGNPRGTSGLHLLDDDLPLLETVLGHNDYQPAAKAVLPEMIAGAMPLWGVADALRSGHPWRFVHDFFSARDVLFRWSDPLPGLALPLTLAELGLIAVREGRTLQQAVNTGYRVEW